jgi:hypothetical protein
MEMKFDQDFAHSIEDMAEAKGLCLSASELSSTAGKGYAMSIVNHKSSAEYRITDSGILCAVKVSTSRECDKTHFCKDGSQLHYTDRSLSSEVRTNIELIREICPVNCVSDVIDMFFE